MPAPNADDTAAVMKFCAVFGTGPYASIMSICGSCGYTNETARRRIRGFR